MAMVIKSTFASTDGPKSAIDMAVFAAEECLKRAGVPVHAIDLLINTGVFRDENIIEPAIAPLIQRKLGMNLDPVENDHLHRSTFSFDITDGENGFLTAAGVARAFLQTRQARYALVVSGDVHPSMTDHEAFPFESMAAAALLAGEDTGRDQGFQDFHFRTSANGSYGFCANVDLSRNGLEGRRTMSFSVDPDYHEKLGHFASGMLQEIFSGGKIDPAGLRYILTSQHTEAFGRRILDQLNLEGVETVDLYSTCGNPHTSSLIAGYDYVSTRGLLKSGDRVLFVSAGAGLSAACSLYTV